MVAVAGGADVDSVLKRSAFRSSGDLAVFNGVTGSLEVAKRRVQSSRVLVVGAHISRIDGVAFHIGGIRDLIAVVGDLRSRPGRVGDRVVDDGSGLAVVGVNALIAVRREDGHDGLAEILGSLGSGIVADLDVAGSQSDVAIAAVVHQAGGDDRAVVAFSAVDVSDLIDNFEGEGRVGDVERAGLHAGDLIGFLGFLHVDVAVLRGAQIVVRVGVGVEHAVGVFLEDVGTCAHRSAGLGADKAQIALREAERVVVVIIEARVAVVVHRRDLHLELIDRGGRQLAGGQRHAVIAGLDNAFDMVGRFTGLHADDVVVPGIANLLREEVGDGSGGNFLVDAVVREIVAIGLNDLAPQLSGVIGLIAPHGDRSREVSRAVVFHDIVRNGLCKLFARGLERSPERVVLLLGVEVVGFIAVGAGREDDVHTGIHAAAILVDADDRHGVERCGAIIGRVHVDIHIKDDVVDGHRRAIGEGDVVTQRDGIGDGAVVVLGDLTVSQTIIRIVGAVVAAGLAFDAVHDDLAAAIRIQQNSLCQGVRGLVRRGSGEERAELALKAGLRDDDRAIGVANGLVGGVLAAFGGVLAGVVRGRGVRGRRRVVRRLAGAAGKQTEAEHERKEQSDELLHVFHFQTS